MCRVGFLSGRGVAGVVFFPCFSHIFLLVSSIAVFFSMCFCFFFRICSVCFQCFVFVVV